MPFGVHVPLAHAFVGVRDINRTGVVMTTNKLLHVEALRVIIV